MIALCFNFSIVSSYEKSSKGAKMKKTLYCLFVFVITIAFLAVTVPGSVSASAGDIGSGIWATPGSSLAFTTVNVDKAAKSAPNWLQQLSEGIVITAPAKICYPFRGGEYGWQPSIRQLSNGKWTAVATKVEFPFTKEAVSYACASAPAAGTYALFGYYNGPVETASSELPVCTGIEFSGGFGNYSDEGSPILSIWLDSVPESLNGKALSYTILGFDYTGEATLTLSPMSAPFWFNSTIDEYNRSISKNFNMDVTGIQIRVTTPSCYQDIYLNEYDD
jgi:hypothetical protein